MPNDIGTGGFATNYPNLRQVVGGQYAVLPDRMIQAQMEAAFGPEAAEQYEEYLEGIFDDIGNAFRSAAKTVAKAAPAIATVGGGALQGALAGSQFGLPGIIAGAATGGVGAGLSKYGSGTARDIGGALTGVTNIASQFSPMGRVGASLGPAVSGLAGSGRAGAAGAAVNALSGLLGAAGGGGGTAGTVLSALSGLLGQGGSAGGGGAGASGLPVAALTSLFGGSSAASQLGSLVQRPEFRLALEKLKLGGGGTVPVGAAGTPVPAAAIAGLARELADEAADEAAAEYADAESDLGYMTDASGQFVGDPAVALDRAAQVWNLLNNAQAERLLNAFAQLPPPRTARIRPPYADQESVDQESSDEAYYDALDMAEVLAMDPEDQGFSEADYEWQGSFG